MNLLVNVIFLASALNLAYFPSACYADAKKVTEYKKYPLFRDKKSVDTYYTKLLSLYSSDHKDMASRFMSDGFTCQKSTDKNTGHSVRSDVRIEYICIYAYCLSGNYIFAKKRLMTVFIYLNKGISNSVSLAQQPMRCPKTRKELVFIQEEMHF